jgi:hypothetical protein
MIQKTRSWLLSRKSEPKRAFHIDPKSLDSFGGAPADVTNAYIVWSLTYAKLKDGLDSQASAPSSLLGFSRCISTLTQTHGVKTDKGLRRRPKY